MWLIQNIATPLVGVGKCPTRVSGFCPSCGQFALNHEQHGPWQQIKALHKRTFAHHFCQFGTGEDKQIEDAMSSCKPCERG